MQHKFVRGRKRRLLEKAPQNFFETWTAPVSPPAAQATKVVCRAFFPGYGVPVLLEPALAAMPLVPPD
jgi:hypothetical protein